MLTTRTVHHALVAESSSHSLRVCLDSQPRLYGRTNRSRSHFHSKWNDSSWSKASRTSKGGDSWQSQCQGTFIISRTEFESSSLLTPRCLSYSSRHVVGLEIRILERTVRLPDSNPKPLCPNVFIVLYTVSDDSVCGEPSGQVV